MRDQADKVSALEQQLGILGISTASPEPHVARDARSGDCAAARSPSGWPEQDADLLLRAVFDGAKALTGHARPPNNSIDSLAGTDQSPRQIRFASRRYLQLRGIALSRVRRRQTSS